MIISAISSPVYCAIIALSYFPTDLTGAIQTVPVAVADPLTKTMAPGAKAVRDHGHRWLYGDMCGRGHIRGVALAGATGPRSAQLSVESAEYRPEWSAHRSFGTARRVDVSACEEFHFGLSGESLGGPWSAAPADRQGVGAPSGTPALRAA
jgi:hypothetical protein